MLQQVPEEVRNSAEAMYACSGNVVIHDRT